jgi:hypothetical protein
MTRRCEGTTNAGKPCGANPLKPGTVIDGITVSGDYCRKHDLLLPASARLQGLQPGGEKGRPPKRRVVDVILDRIEEKVDELFDILWEAAHAERAVVVGNGPTAFVEMVPDHPTRKAAVAEMLDRGYGRPKQSSEVTVITQDAIDVAIERMERELAERDGDSGEPGVDRALQASESSASG